MAIMSNSTAVQMMGRDPVVPYESAPISTPSTISTLTGTEPTTNKETRLDPETADIIPNNTTLDTPLQLVTNALDITDDPSESPYTFRAFIIGLGLSSFGAVIAEIFYFKPQTVGVQPIFLIIAAFCLGETSVLIPRWGPLGRFLNPGPFSQKEHVFIVIMASSAAGSALGTEQLAVQSLYYGKQPGAVSAIFMLFSSQCIGYGLLGVMRKTFIYPTKFVWPTSLPLASLFQSMHLNKDLAMKRMRLFWYLCLGVMIWEIVPQYVFPLTVGISVFCLANQNSAVFTHLFGGTNGNEGMGLFSWSMDWQYIGTTQFVLPLNTLVNQLVGYVGCVILTVAAYYFNLWNAWDYPFLAQALFTSNGTVYNQTEILDKNNEVDTGALSAYGLPMFATSNTLSLLTMNMGTTAAVMHIFLWNWNDVKLFFATFAPQTIKAHLISATTPLQHWKISGRTNDQPSPTPKPFPGTEGDPHFAAMSAYKDAPSWWYHGVLILATAIGLECCYEQETGLPWWAFFTALGLAWFLTAIFACMCGITGFYFPPATAIQMIGAYLVPRRPVANMMFTLYGSNALMQAIAMLADLKLAQYAKLPPRATFAAQMVGTCVGAVLNWVTMNSIVESQRGVLVSVEGTSVWSGQNVQTYNAQAVAWGGAGNEMFGRDGIYWMVPMGLLFGLVAPIPFWIGHKFFPKLRLDYFNTFIICTWLGVLSVGINSSLMAYFVFGFLAQGYIRRYRPLLFAKWNLIVAAGIAGGCSLIVFILTFAVFGGSGTERLFPAWWGNNNQGNVDRCLYMNGD
ncbi:OPT superfamily oligopeptide transporter [Podospora appendiculata]|uniref:OPT superfamily oligopeptide transporter n=1 Tax=Podospora appendiculata TaxID=314037 RepID=A0AAE1C7U8_9PEZI|nr:OPT superfamily oligopeptide transporter [Podospora appendiculata]